MPQPVPQAAKRKWSDEMDGEPFAAGRPQHLELDKWLRHTIASRRREQERREAAILERKRSREAHREREARRQGQEGMVGNDGSQSMEEDLEDEVEEGPKTLQERLLQAQIDRDGSSRIEVDGHARNTEGWGGVDGVRCRLHSADRLHGLKPCLVMNLFPGGFSIDGEQQGRVYGKDSKEFLEGLDRGKIPARKLLELAGHSNFSYSDGCLLVEVRDFRVPRNADQKPAVWTVVLTADSGAVAKDLAVVAESYQNLNSDDLLLVEKRMLVMTQPTVCLTPDPHVAVVASSLQRRANRMGVWHARQARATASVSRRTFDAGAMRRLHAAVHVSTTPGLDLANPPLSSRPARPDTEEVDDEEGSVGSTEGSLPSLRPGHDTVPVCRGVWKNNRVLEGWDMDGDGKDGAIQMATALRQLKASQFRWEVDQDKLPGPKSSHGMASGKRGANDGERAIARNFFLPRQYLRDGTPPERQMRFRKGNQIVTIAIESKGASSFQLRSWLHEFGDDGKPLENGQVNMPPQMIGNSVQARIFGGQLFAVYHRDGWQCTGDSHQPATRKGIAGGQGTGGAARPTGQQQQQQQQRSAGPGGMNNAGRGMSPGGGRGVAPAGYAGNGGPAGPVRQAVSKTKAAPQAHQQMTSPHMMAGRGAPQMHPQQQARAPMPHPGGVPGQQMHMQHGYRPTAGAHQMPPQHQQYAHQVPAHAAHPAHQAQGVPPYHSAAGRGYPPQQYQGLTCPPRLCASRRRSASCRPCALP